MIWPSVYKNTYVYLHIKNGANISGDYLKFYFFNKHKLFIYLKKKSEIQIIGEIASKYFKNNYFVCPQTPSKKKIEISTIASNYHLEVNPR